MKHYVGLDVSMKKTSVCIVNELGKIVHESTVNTDPQALADAIQKTGLEVELVGFESGSLGHYLTQCFKERALPAVCIDARKMSMILSVRINKTDKNDAITEIFKSKAILLGSPTVNNGFLVSVAALLEEIKGLKFKKKKAGAFGSYGWSGEAVKVLSERLTDAGFQIVDAGLRLTWSPDEENKRLCRDYGKNFVQGLLS